MEIGWHRLMVASILLAGGCTAQNQNNVCAVNPVSTLKLTIGNSGTASTMGAINGVSATMYLDTGSEISVLSPSLAVAAKAYFINADEQLLYTGVAGSGSSNIAEVNSFVIGGMTATQVQFVVIPQKRDNKHDSAIHTLWGTLGVDIFSNYDVDLNYPDKTASLYDMSGCASIAFPWSGMTAVIPLHLGSKNAIYLPVTVNGQSFMALLDSGASISTIPKALFDQSGLAAQANGPLVSIHGHAIDNGAIDGKLYRFHSIKIGGVPMQDAYLLVTPPPSADDPRGPLRRYEASLAVKQSPDDLDLRQESGNMITIGADFLRTHRIYISYMTKTAYVPQ